MQDTDAAAARGRARLRYMLTLWFLGASAPAFGQDNDPAALQIEITNNTCLRSDPLRARIAHYMARKSPPPGLRVVVDLENGAASEGAELRIYRDLALLSRRCFERLPTACDEQRDAVALSIALALEDPAVRAAADEGARTPVAPATAASTSSDERADSASTTAETQADAAPAAPTPPPPSHDTNSSSQDTTPSDPVIEGTLPSSVSHSRSSDSSLGVALQIGARWLAGALPFPVWAGSLGLALALSQHISVALSAVASTLGERTFEAGRARGRLYGLEAIGCNGLGLGAAVLELCAGAAAAACEVSGRDYPMARPDTTLLWAAGLARAALRWPAASTFSLRLLVQAQLNISRPTLEVERATRMLEPPWVGMTAGVELVVTLP